MKLPTKGTSEPGDPAPVSEKPVKPSRSSRKAAREAAAAARKKFKSQSKKLKELDEKPGGFGKKGHKGKPQPAPKTTQQFLGYQLMMEDGLCQVEPELFSRTIKFSDINYEAARRDDQIDIFTRYCELLNYCDSSIHMQFTIINRSIDKDVFRATMLIPPAEDTLDPYRREINEMLMDKALEGQNSMIREKYLTFSTTAPSMSAAVPALARLETDFAENLRSLGCDTISLSGVQRLGLIHNLFYPNEQFSFQYSDLVSTGLTTKSAVAPTSLDFRDRAHFGFGDHLGQVLVLQKMPTEMTDRLVSTLTELPMNMIITLHISNVDQAEALEYVRTQIAGMEAEITRKQSKAVAMEQNPALAVPMETRRSYEDAQKLLDNLENKNQHMFKVTVLVYTYADTEDALKENVFQLMAIARKINVKLSALEYRQREGLNSTLPLGKNHVAVERTLTTATTAIFVPFTTMELYQPGGIYYGLNAKSHNLIFFNRENLNVASGMILGSPGSGKSMAAKREIISVLLSDPNADVLVIDPEREYTPLANGFGGQIVHVSAGSKDHLNPMDITMDYSDEDDPLVLKQEFILDICELLIGGKQGLSGGQRSIIGRACKLSYQRYFNHPKPENIPTLQDFYDQVKDQPEQDAQRLALDLELYIKGGLSVFAHPTNVDANNRFVVYDVKDLGKQLRTFGMTVVLDQIWNRITANRDAGKRTWLYIDEFQLLLCNGATSTYFFELWTRARKWGAIPTGITQNVETLLLSDDARRMLSNSEFIMMLRQATSDRTELAGLLNISSQQLKYVTNSGPGQGLLFAGKSIIPFIDHFPKDTQLYRMMTTKIDEVSHHESEA